MPRAKTKTVRPGATPSGLAASGADEFGSCEDVRYVEDEAFHRLKAELQRAFAAPESAGRPLTASEVIARNKA